MRGGFTVRVTYVRENRAYLTENVVDVPWSNKQLAIKWEHFRSKLLPAQKETWTAIVTGPDAKRTSVERWSPHSTMRRSINMRPHNWPQMFDIFRTKTPRSESEFQNSLLPFRNVLRWESPTARHACIGATAHFPEILETWATGKRSSCLPSKWNQSEIRLCRELHAGRHPREYHSERLRFSQPTGCRTATTAGPWK